MSRDCGFSSGQAENLFTEILSYAPRGNIGTLEKVRHMTYIDPGAGSLVIQVALGILAAALFSLKLFWSRVRIWFGKVFRHRRQK